MFRDVVLIDPGSLGQVVKVMHISSKIYYCVIFFYESLCMRT